MDLKTVFSKTPKASRAPLPWVGGLSAQFKQILSYIDGKQSVEEILHKAGKLSINELHKILLKLEEDGYIKRVSSHQAEPDWLNDISSYGISANNNYSIAVEEIDAADLDFNDADFSANTAAEIRETTEQEQQAKAKVDPGVERRAQEVKAIKAKREAERKAQAEAAENARLEAAEQAKRIAEAAEKARQEVERIAREKSEAEAQAKAEAERKAQAEAEEYARLEAERKAQAEAAEKAKLEAERIAREEAEELARIEHERKVQEALAEKARQEAEEQARLEAERIAREKAEAIAKAKAEEEARLQAEAERKAQAEAAERARLEAERIAREEAEEKARLEAERIAREEAEAIAKAKAEEEARLQAEAERKAKAEAEEQARVEAERKAQAEAAEQLRLEQERIAREEAEELVRIENERRVQEELAEKARQEAEENARLEAERVEREKAEAIARAESEEQARLQAEAERKAKAEEEEKARAEAERIAEIEVAEQKLREAERVAREELKAQQEAEKKAQAAAEKAAREEAKRLAKEEKAEKSRLKAEEKAHAKALRGPIMLNKLSAKLLKPLLIAIPLVLILAVGLIHVMSLTMLIVPVEKLASDSIGEPVKVQEVHASLFPQPNLVLTGVSVGSNAEVKIGSVNIVSAISMLFKDVKDIQSIAINNVTLTPAEFARQAKWVDGTAKSGKLNIAQITLKQISFKVSDLEPETFNGKVTLTSSGELGNVELTNARGNMTLLLTPQNGSCAVTLTASDWQPPLFKRLALDEVTATGVISQNQLSFSQIEAKAFGGTIKARGELSWAGRLSTSGNFELIKMTLPRLLSAYDSGVAVDGILNATAAFTGSADQASALVQATEVDANFEALTGKVNGIALSHALVAGPGSKPLPDADFTRFDTLTGNLQYKGGQYKYKQFALKTEQFRARGNFNIEPDKTVSGKISAELTSTSQRRQGSFVVSGEVADVKFK